MRHGNAVFLILAALALAAPASEIDFGVDPARHYRFLGGFDTGAPIANPGVLGGGLDFTGVGWSNSFPGLNVALISPKHFAVAQHALRSGGETLKFLNADGEVKTFTIAGIGAGGYVIPTFDGLPGDVAIGTLVETVDLDPITGDKLTIYDVLKAGPMPATFPADPSLDPTLSFYLGQSAVVVGKNEILDPLGGLGGYQPLGGKVSRDPIAGLLPFSFGGPANTVGYVWQTSPTTPDSGRLVDFDSGSPGFLEYGGKLYFMGSNSGIDGPIASQLNVGGFLPWYVDSLNAQLAPSGFQIGIFTPVPEPGTLALMGLAAAAFLMRRRMRGRVPHRLPAGPTARRA